ncbi:MAG: cupin domain-containing protein, partial [Pseudomonadota bacterium]|nr:cupin domain-containing protein [Pseudomonadota bacterium]
MRKNFFNLHKQDQGILRELAPGVSTRIFTGDHAMLSVVCLDPGCESEIHSHPPDQWGILL